MRRAPEVRDAARGRWLLAVRCATTQSPERSRASARRTRRSVRTSKSSPTARSRASWACSPGESVRTRAFSCGSLGLQPRRARRGEHRFYRSDSAARRASASLVKGEYEYYPLGGVDSLDASRSSRPPRRRLHRGRRPASTIKVRHLAHRSWRARRRAGSSCCARSASTSTWRPAATTSCRSPGLAPAELASHHAGEKLRAVLRHRHDRRHDVPVLAADTVVDLDGDALGKPRDRRRGDCACCERLSGREHLVHTAFALAVPGIGAGSEERATTRVRFYALRAGRDRRVRGDRRAARQGRRLRNSRTRRVVGRVDRRRLLYRRGLAAGPLHSCAAAVGICAPGNECIG